VLDASGSLQSRYWYDPYGRRSALLENQPAPFAYTGHFRHPASGLYLAPARFYSSELGRWLSRDPLGESQGANLYAYSGNNPLDRIDPQGLCWNEIKQDASDLAGEAASEFGDWWHNRVYYGLYVHYWLDRGTRLQELKNWATDKETAVEVALGVVKGAEAGLQVISREVSVSPIVPVTEVLTIDPAATAGGTSYAGAEGLGAINFNQLSKMTDGAASSEPTQMLNAISGIQNGAMR
jgi:RHS repeat-associated protein